MPDIIIDTTDEYPTRYAAFRRHGVLFIYEGETIKPGEVACYYEPLQNSQYPHLTDGIYGEVHTLHPVEKRGYYASVHATRQDGSRQQKNRGQIFPPAEREAAIAFLIEHLETAHQWLLLPLSVVLGRAADNAEKMARDCRPDDVNRHAHARSAQQLREEQAKATALEAASPDGQLPLC